MRPEKFNYLMGKAIDHRLKTGENTLFDAQLRRAMRKYWAKMAKEQDDHRPLEELGGYGFESQESIENTLFYISDRWRAAFRLRWIMEGVEKGHI